MPLMGNGEGHTVLILTDAESRLIREQLDGQPGRTNSDAHREAAFASWNRGIQRGTERIQAEFDAEQRKRKEGKK